MAWFSICYTSTIKILTVGMPHRRDEAHLRWQQWELGWECQPSLEESSLAVEFINSEYFATYTTDVAYYMVSAGLQK